jgi:hypothetical protein
MASHSTPDHGGIVSMDAQITQYTNNTILKLTECLWSDARLNHIFVSLNDLRLFAARPTMLSFDCVPETARICSSIASDTTMRIAHVSLAGPMPSHRRHEASSLTHALVTFCALLVRSFRMPEEDALTPLADKHLTDSFRHTLEILRNMASTLPLAQRLVDDFSPLVSLLNRIIDAREGSDAPQPHAQPADTSPAIPHNILDLFPYRDVEPVKYAVPRWSEGGETPGPGTWESGVDWRHGAQVLWM